jgi:hypothetical protein
MLLLVHGGHEPLDFVLPPIGSGGGPWKLLLDTADDAADETAGDRATLTGRSLRLYGRTACGADSPRSDSLRESSPPSLRRTGL